MEVKVARLEEKQDATHAGMMRIESKLDKIDQAKADKWVERALIATFAWFMSVVSFIAKWVWDHIPKK